MTAKRVKSKAKPASAIETSKNIADQTAAFLKAGGNVTKINTGVSGQTGLGYTKKPEATAEQAKATTEQPEAATEQAKA
ncbi:MAG: hypothetical protein ACI89D_001145 [Bermanella sp.]|jgi:hypothetical protein